MIFIVKIKIKWALCVLRDAISNFHRPEIQDLLTLEIFQTIT